MMKRLWCWLTRHKWVERLTSDSADCARCGRHVTALERVEKGL